MKQISSIVLSITLAALLAGALTAVARQKEARADAAATAEGLMPVVDVIAPGPNQVVGEILVRPTVPGNLAVSAASLPAVN